MKAHKVVREVYFDGVKRSSPAGFVEIKMPAQIVLRVLRRQYYIAWQALVSNYHASFGIYCKAFQMQLAVAATTFECQMSVWELWETPVRCTATAVAL
eukprot:4756039-Pleurochrysis_carterae.AAC.1